MSATVALVRSLAAVSRVRAAAAAGSRLVCGGCGCVVDPGEPHPFRCPAARPEDDVDHVLRRELDPAAFDEAARETLRGRFLAGGPSPFVAFRDLLHSCRTARAAGLARGEFVELARDLDAAVAEVEGHGFRRTPFVPSPPLGEALGLGGGLAWVKDETGNVAGSHKGRHFFGVALWLAVQGRLGRLSPAELARPLAVASCGNAALAAAVVARAMDRRLLVFVPPDADPAIVARLHQLGAAVRVCARRAGDPPGDPCVRAFRAALASGALPFSCQGSDNGLAIEGGATLAWEIVAELVRRDAAVDHLVVQVGGGALASAVVAGLDDAHALGLLPRLPRIHAVQTASAHPLERAHAAVVAELRATLGDALPAESDAAALAARDLRPAVAAALCFAARNRSRFMRPWPTAPRSVAHGILDDETYDWLAVVRGMLATAGLPLVVDEPTLLEANALAVAATGIPVDATGSAGLAGALALARRGGIAPGESVAVLFTGVDRAPRP